MHDITLVAFGRLACPAESPVDPARAPHAPARVGRAEGLPSARWEGFDRSLSLEQWAGLGGLRSLPPTGVPLTPIDGAAPSPTAALVAQSGHTGNPLAASDALVCRPRGERSFGIAPSYDPARDLSLSFGALSSCAVSSYPQD